MASLPGIFQFLTAITFSITTDFLIISTWLQLLFHSTFFCKVQDKIDQKIFLKVIALFRLNEYNYISFQIQKQVRGVTNERIYNGSRSC